MQKASSGRLFAWWAELSVMREGHALVDGTDMDTAVELYGENP